MNTLRKEDLLLEQPSLEEQKELLEIFKELDVKVQKKVDIIMNRSSSCKSGWWGWKSTWSCAACR